MNRRDAGVVLWAAAGFYALWGGASRLWQSIELAVLSASYRSAMATGMNRSQALAALIAVVGLLEAIAGLALLRQRAALARWLFPQEEAIVGVQREGSAVIQISSPSEKEIQGSPAVDTESKIVAQEVSTVVVAAIGIWVMLAGVSDLKFWLQERASRGWTYGSLVYLLGTLLFGGLGWLVLWQRERISARVLQRSVTTPGPSEIESAGIRLLGLFMILWYIPSLPRWIVGGVRAISGERWETWQQISSEDVQDVFAILLGSVLFSGRGALKASWRKLRSADEEEDSIDTSHFD